MKLSLAEGIDLDVTKTDQFNSTTIIINLILPWNAQNSAQRAIVARMMATANEEYPTQRLFAKHLAWMNGADYDCDVLRYGDTHITQLMLTIPNSPMLDNQSLLKMAFQFIEAVLFKPLIANDQFDSAVFNLQKTNMIRYLASIEDDKEEYAMDRLVKLYRQSRPDLAENVIGNLAQIKSLQPDLAYRSYLDMIKNAQVQITVLGDVNVDLVRHQVSRWPLVKRCSILKPLKVLAERHPFQLAEEHQSIQQTRLCLAYSLPIYYDDEQFFAAVILNAMLGGTTNSLLFKVVREKYQFAYEVNSYYNALSGSVYVQAGVDQKQCLQAQQLIKAQITELQAGRFTLADLQQIKTDLLNLKQAELDDPRKLALQKGDEIILKRRQSFQTWQLQLERVTMKQITAAAQKMTLQAQFILWGDAY